MFTKILIANRGESARKARTWAQPNCKVRAAHAGGFNPIEVTNV
jgi:acetyl/propionyl-CoA carboxylase alpha subunit